MNGIHSSSLGERAVRLVSTPSLESVQLALSHKPFLVHSANGHCMTVFQGAGRIVDMAVVTK